LLLAPNYNAVHYHHALDLLVLHVPTSTLDKGPRRCSLCCNWMHKGTLLRVHDHNAMHYHHALDLLVLHVPTGTLHEGSRRSGLRSNWMHKGTVLRMPHHNTSTANHPTHLAVHDCCACLAMHNPRDALVLRRRTRSRSEGADSKGGCYHFAVSLSTVLPMVALFSFGALAIAVVIRRTARGSTRHVRLVAAQTDEDLLSGSSDAEMLLE